MSDENSFCTKCGCNLPAGVNYCPKCGAAVPGSAGYVSEAQQAAEFQKAMNEGQRNMLLFALAVYVIPAIIFAIIVLADHSNIADTLINNASFKEWMTKHNWNLDDVKNYVVYCGVLELISGLCASVSLFLLYRGEKRIIATVFCFIAAALCFWSVFGMFLGFLVAIMILESEACFKDEVHKE